MKNKTITIYDIAKESEVSPATVSRVITGKANVSPDKLQKINETIAKHNFQPNMFARGLLKNESKTIGCIIPDISNPFFGDVYLELEKNALKKGYTLIMGNSMDKPNIESKMITLFSQKQVDAFIFIGGRINDMNLDKKYYVELENIAKTKPVVLLNSCFDVPNAYNISTDEESGIFHLVNHLVKLGHKEIGIFGGKKNISSAIIKQNAFRQAMKLNEIDVNENWISFGGYSVESGIKSMNELLLTKNVPTAIIGINDYVAFGMLRQAQVYELNVPKDISIAGFDGSAFSKMAYPTLTTVSQNVSTLGKLAIDTILNIKKGEKFEFIKKVDTTLVLGGSTGPCF